MKLGDEAADEIYGSQGNIMDANNFRKMDLAKNNPNNDSIVKRHYLDSSMS